MLERDVEEIESDEEIRDMLGEMGNIVGGNLKSVFTDAGLICALSTPSFTSGSDFKIEAHDMENFDQLAFRCGKNVIVVELGVKISEWVQTDMQQGKDIPTVGDETTQAEIPAESQQVEAQDSSTTASKPVETQDSKTPEDLDLDLLLDIPLELKVELGRARIKIHKLLKLAPGSAVKLIKLEGDPVDIMVNSTLIARGEVVVQNEKYGIRVTEITNRMDRIRSFSI
jgi:flagellar motor switch protein FliN